MNKLTFAVGVTALAVVLAVSACGDSETDPAAATASTTTSVTTSAAEDAAAHNQADVMFARMMIPHHTQAIEMSDMLLAKDGIPEAVTALAEQIKAAQKPEIDEMSAWLDKWGEARMPDEMPGTDHDMHGMSSAPETGGGMGGMMSAQEVQALEAAQGIEAARLFLTGMITHHEGAIDMAQTEIEDGQFPDAVRLAGSIVDTQRQEIETMRQLLATL